VRRDRHGVDKKEPLEVSLPVVLFPASSVASCLPASVATLEETNYSRGFECAHPGVGDCLG